MLDNICELKFCFMLYDVVDQSVSALVACSSDRVFIFRMGHSLVLIIVVSALDYVLTCVLISITIAVLRRGIIFR